MCESAVRGATSLPILVRMNATSNASDDAFAPLIAPISPADFFKRYFEREVLHVARHDSAYFGGLYSVRCVEDALVLGANEPDHFALIKDDEIGASEITSERSPVRFRSARQAPRKLIDPRSVLAAFADGYTLNIKDAGAFHPPLAQLCNRIQAQLGVYVHTNVYFTPPRAQGFGIHYDTHDTLIVQIEGVKEWDIHEPAVPLPLEMQKFSKTAHAGKLDTPRRVRLEAGDSLYIPHGFPHEAQTGDHRSLHLTFALAPIRAVDLLDAIVQLAALGEVELRRALPPGWHRDPAFAAAFGKSLAAILPRAIAPARVALATDFAFNELFAATRTTAAGAFDTLAACDGLAPDSRISLRTDTPYALRPRGDRLHVVLAAKIVTLPLAARAGFARLELGPATFAELGRLLPAETAANFVRTLALDNIIVVQEPQAPLGTLSYDSARLKTRG
jgi:ribosomal protein L16 Arg81 hydroxylase